MTSVRRWRGAALIQDDRGQNIQKVRRKSMSRNEFAKTARRRIGNLKSTEDAVAAGLLLHYTVGEGEMKRRELEDAMDELGVELDCADAGPALTQLRRNDFTDRSQSGPDSYIIHERRDEVINGENLNEVVPEEIDRLIEDMENDEKVALTADGGEETEEEEEVVIRDVLADEFGVDEDEVEETLRSGGVFDRMDNLGEAVEAIEESDDVEKGGEYDNIFVTGNPYRHQLTDRAIALVEG
jgi:hypothetical protein